MEKGLTWIGGAVVALFAIYGLLHFFDVRFSVSSYGSYRDVDWAERGNSGYVPSGFHITHDR